MRQEMHQDQKQEPEERNLSEYEKLEEMHESDLTPEQKRKLERERFKRMNGSQRLRYFWDYYKWVVIVAIIAAIVLYEGIGIWRRLHQTTLLSVAIMDSALGRSEDVNRFAEDLAMFLGTGEKDEIVEVDTAVMSGNTVAAVTKMTVVTAAGVTDAAFLNEETWQTYDEQGAFRDWKEALGDDYDRYAELFDEKGRMDVSGNEKWGSYQLTYYEPVYCCLLEQAPRPETAARLAAFFAE